MTAEELLAADIELVSGDVEKLKGDYCELADKHEWLVESHKQLAEDCKWLRVELDRETRLNNELGYWVFGPYAVAVVAAAVYGLASFMKWLYQ